MTLISPHPISTAPITIRSFQQHNLTALDALARITFLETFGHLYTADDLAIHLEKSCSAAFFERELARGCQILLACAGKALAGYVKFGAVELPASHAPGDAEVHKLYVSSSYQRQGVGKMLMEAVITTCRAANLFLGVWEHNARAQTFYRSFGFEPVGEHTYYVGSQGDRDIIMKRQPTA